MKNVRQKIVDLINRWKQRRTKTVEYFKQNASGLYLDLQKIGCFFRAACHMAELQTEKDGNPTALTIAQLNKLWDLAKSLKYINENLNVKDSAAIANLALKELGLGGRFVEVALIQDGEQMYYPGVPEDDRRSDYFIQKIAQNGPSKTHFTNVDKTENLLWDPHDPEITKQGVYYTICYRYDRRIK